MFHLPYEILLYIYSFDNTYIEKYQECLNIIKYLPKIINIRSHKKYYLENVYNEISNDFIYSRNGIFFYNYFIINFDIKNDHTAIKLYSYLRNIYNIDKKYYYWLFKTLPSLEELVRSNKINF